LNPNEAGDSRIYTARYLLPISSPPVAGGALLVAGEQIVAVGPLADIRAVDGTAEVVDFGDKVLLPPLTNAHTHLELTDFPSWAVEADEDEPIGEEDFVGWVLRLVRVKRARPAEDFVPAIQRGLRLCLESGTGVIGDILSFHSAVDAYRQSPLLGSVFFETLGRDPKLFSSLLDRIGKRLDRSPSSRLSAAVSPHAPYTVAAELLRRVFALAAGRRCPAAIHLAESTAESELLRDGNGPLVDRLYAHAGWLEPPATGLSPVAWLEEQGGLRPDILLVHGVQVDVGDVERLKRHGSGVVLCPRSNEKLRVGRAPVELYRQAGVPLALGTDSLASSDSLSMWDELAAARRIYADALDPVELLRAATIGGARLLGVDARIGTLEPGRGANFQVVDLPPAANPTELIEALVAEGCRQPVRQLYLHGRPQIPHFSPTKQTIQV